MQESLLTLDNTLISASSLSKGGAVNAFRMLIHSFKTSESSSSDRTGCDVALACVSLAMLFGAVL